VKAKDGRKHFLMSMERGWAGERLTVEGRPSSRVDHGRLERLHSMKIFMRLLDENSLPSKIKAEKKTFLPWNDDHESSSVQDEGVDVEGE